MTAAPYAPPTALNSMAAVSPASAMSMANSRMSGMHPGMRRGFGLSLSRLPAMNAPHPQPDVGRASVNEVQQALAQQRQSESVGMKLAELLEAGPSVRIQRFEEEHGPVRSTRFLPPVEQAGGGKSGRKLDFSAPFAFMRSSRA